MNLCFVYNLIVFYNTVSLEIDVVLLATIKHTTQSNIKQDMFGNCTEFS